MLNQNPLANLFKRKTKAEIEREDREYARWAFPYGEHQRSNLMALLTELYPGKGKGATLGLVAFLTCRELYEDALKNTGERDAAIDNMLNTVRKYKSVIKVKEMPLCLAIVLANEKVGNDAVYPDAASVKALAEELSQKRTPKVK